MPSMFDVLRVLATVISVFFSRPHYVYIGLKFKSFELCFAAGPVGTNSLEQGKIEKCVKYGIAIAAVIGTVLFL